MRIALAVNGEAVALDARPDEMLLDLLRRDLGLRSVRATCGIGVCGTCTALVDGRPVSTCLLLAPLAEGREVTTVEALGGADPVQRAFVEAHGFQCGYCTPGMILTAKSLLVGNPRPSDEEIRLALAGNLCRCGCYVKIADAVRIAAEAAP